MRFKIALLSAAYQYPTLDLSIQTISSSMIGVKQFPARLTLYGLELRTPGTSTLLDVQIRDTVQ